MARPRVRTLTIPGTRSVIVKPREITAVLTTAAANDTARVLQVSDEKPTTLGRSDACTYHFHQESVSGAPARIDRVGQHYMLTDQRSTNGTYVNDVRITEAMRLRTGDLIRLGPNVPLRFSLMEEEEQRALVSVYEAASTDALTRLSNRHHLDGRLDSEVAYALRHLSDLVVVMVDIDHFKRVNDEHGHAAGDALLVHVSEVLAKALRTEDLLGRYGGEEFVVLTRGTSLRQAAVMSERLRRRIEESPLAWEDSLSASAPVQLSATISVGVAGLVECEPRTKAALLQLADERLYRAKNEGRNRVCLT